MQPGSGVGLSATLSAAEETIIPLAAVEAAQAAAELPLAFASVDGVTQLVAVMSAKPGRNWFVGSDGSMAGAIDFPVCAVWRAPIRFASPAQTRRTVRLMDRERTFIRGGR